MVLEVSYIKVFGLALHGLILGPFYPSVNNMRETFGEGGGGHASVRVQCVSKLFYDLEEKVKVSRVRPFGDIAEPGGADSGPGKGRALRPRQSSG